MPVEPSLVFVLLTLVPLALLMYSYAGYPALLWALTRFPRRRRRAEAKPASWPTVSVLVSAYNEELVIADRIENLLALDYPKNRLEILVGSDGSTDATAAIVNTYASRGVRLLPFVKRRGKANVLNDLAATARGEILVLTDANCAFEPDAVRQLVQDLVADPRSCAVVGRLDLRGARNAGTLDTSYWRYETWLKTMESSLGAVLGANGAIYAIRRAQYVPLPRQAIVDDFILPMSIRLRWGGHVVLQPAARAWEVAPVRVQHEFRRRTRIGSGDFQALRWTWRLLLPWRGPVAIVYLSHKVLRWLGPWFLLTSLLANLQLLERPLFQALFVGQVGFYALATAAGFVRRVPVLGLMAAAAQYFTVINAGLMLGLVRLLLGRARPFWATVPREVPALLVASPAAMVGAPVASDSAEPAPSVPRAA